MKPSIFLNSKLQPAPIYPSTLPPNPIPPLERRICILNQLREISLPKPNPISKTEQPHHPRTFLRSSYLEPSPRLRRRLKSITIPTMRIIPRRTRIRSPITLATRFHPHKSIFEGIACVSGGSNTETGAFYVAPVAPGGLLGWLDAVSAWNEQTDTHQLTILPKELFHL